VAPPGRQEVACEALAARWKAFRDRAAFEELFELLRPRIEGLLYGLLGGDVEEVRDARQEVLTDLLEAIDRFDGRSSLWTFCYRLTKNVAVDRLRSERRRRLRERRAAILAFPVAEGERGEAPDAALLRDGERERLLASLGRLEEGDRRILLMRASGGLSAAEMAEALDIEEGAARTRLYRARERLKAAWEDCDGR
jgi:RNA polymerase sigma-70 factor (ECF subfamily)